MEIHFNEFSYAVSEESLAAIDKVMALETLERLTSTILSGSEMRAKVLGGS